MDLDIRTVENAKIAYEGYESVSPYGYGYLYQLDDDLIGKCNGTKLIFESDSDSESTLFLSVLADPPIA